MAVEAEPALARGPQDGLDLVFLLLHHDSFTGVMRLISHWDVNGSHALFMISIPGYNSLKLNLSSCGVWLLRPNNWSKPHSGAHPFDRSD